MFSEALRLLDREEEKLVIQEAYDELRRTKEELQEAQGKLRKMDEMQGELLEKEQEISELKRLLKLKS